MKHPIGTKPTKRRNPSYIYSILSVALVLFLLGFFLLFLLHAPKWVNEYKEQVIVTAELKDKTTDQEIEDFTNTLRKLPYIKSESVVFKTKEEIAEEMKEDIGNTENSLNILNPFYDEINFNLKADYLQNDSLANIRKSLMEYPFVSDIFYQEILIDKVNANLQKIGWTAFGMGIVFVLIALVLIHNTIRLAMYSNRFLIKNMQLVGASWSFISRPYLNRGLLNGFLSGIIAILILLGILLLINLQFPELLLAIWIEDIGSLIIILTGMILIGMIISFGSTYFVVNKYLKMRLDDLY